MIDCEHINPQLFQMHHSIYKEDIQFWLELARSINGPILEIGCGTGRILIPLARAGFRVVGLDKNIDMLVYLRRQLEAQIQKQVNVFQADAGAFHLAKRYSLIFLACNTLSTIGEATRRQAYKLIFNHLSHEGIFAASIPNPNRLEDLEPNGESALEEIFKHPETGNPLQVSSEWEKLGHNIIIRWHYDHLFPDGRINRSTVEIKHTIISLEIYLEELRSSNFNPAIVYGDFNKSEYSRDSPYLILLARKE